MIPIVEERNVVLILNGAQAYEWRCTPTDLEALAIGRLYIDGAISRADDVTLELDVAVDSAVVIHARTTSPALRPAKTGRCDLPPTEMFAELFRALFAGVDARHEHGGMHAAAATDGQHIVNQAEDVGRHNTIDKIVGVLLLDGMSPTEHGLITSSRVSGEIADKAARAGFCWLASRSIPTTLAVQYAAAANMPIIGRAASREAFVYR